MTEGDKFAFPFQFGMGHAEGMTLREWYAGIAAAGNLAAMNPGTIDDAMAKVIAEEAVKVADALLAAMPKPVLSDDIAF